MCLFYHYSDKIATDVCEISLHPVDVHETQTEYLAVTDALHRVISPICASNAISREHKIVIPRLIVMLNRYVVYHRIFNAKVLQNALSRGPLKNIRFGVNHRVESVLVFLHHKATHARYLEVKVVDDVSALIEISLLSEETRFEAGPDPHKEIFCADLFEKIKFGKVVPMDFFRDLESQIDGQFFNEGVKTLKV